VKASLAGHATSGLGPASLAWPRRGVARPGWAGTPNREGGAAASRRCTACSVRSVMASPGRAGHGNVGLCRAMSGEAGLHMEGWRAACPCVVPPDGFGGCEERLSPATPGWAWPAPAGLSKAGLLSEEWSTACPWAAPPNGSSAAWHGVATLAMARHGAAEPGKEFGSACFGAATHRAAWNGWAWHRRAGTGMAPPSGTTHERVVCRPAGRKRSDRAGQGEAVPGGARWGSASRGKARARPGGWCTASPCAVQPGAARRGAAGMAWPGCPGPGAAWQGMGPTNHSRKVLK